MICSKTFSAADTVAAQDTSGSLWSTLQDLGLDRVGLDPALGGSGGSLADAAVVITACGAAAMSVPITEMALMAGHIAAITGSTLPPGTTTTWWTGDNRTGPVLRADGDSWRLTGSARAVAWGAQADRVLVLAGIGDPTGREVAAVWLDRSTVARLGSVFSTIAGESRVDLTFEQEPVAAQAMTRLPGSASTDLAHLGALGRSCQLLGALRTCLQLTTSYALLRNQFGRPIGTRQVIGHALAEFAGEVGATEAGVSAAVDQLGQTGTPLSAQAAFAIAAAKVQAGRAATVGAAIAHQIHGAVGMTAEHPLHHLTSRLWAWRDEYGAERYWSEQLAAAAGREGLWQLLTDQSRPRTAATAS